jgi:uncharacterized protein (DUF2132 family)
MFTETLSLDISLTLVRPFLPRSTQWSLTFQISHFPWVLYAISSHSSRFYLHKTVWLREQIMTLIIMKRHRLPTTQTCKIEIGLIKTCTSSFPVIIPVGVLCSGYWSTAGDHNSMKCNQRSEIEPISALRTICVSMRPRQAARELRDYWASSDWVAHEKWRHTDWMMIGAGG